MAWTAPKTWSSGEMVDQDEMNLHLRDNLLHLRTPPTVGVASSTGYTTTSTGYVDINAALVGSVVTSGAPLLIIALIHTSGGATPEAKLLLDGSDLTVAGSALVGNNAFFITWSPALAAGTHTIIPQWKTTSGTLTMLRYYMAAREVS